MWEKTKRSFILTQRKMFTCPLRVSSMAFPSYFPSLSWWREGREVTLEGIGVSQSFLFLISPNPIQPLEAEESVQHFHKDPLTQRSKPLSQGGHLYTRIRLGSGPEIAGLVGISLWSNRFVKHHKLDHTWRSMMLINILKALRHPTAKTSASLCLTRCFPIFSAHGILFGLSHPLPFWISVFYGPHIVKCWPSRMDTFIFLMGKVRTREGHSFTSSAHEQRYETVHKKQSKLWTARPGCLGGVFSRPFSSCVAWVSTSPF